MEIQPADSLAFSVPFAPAKKSDKVQTREKNSGLQHLSGPLNPREHSSRQGGDLCTHFTSRPQVLGQGVEDRVRSTSGGDTQSKTNEEAAAFGF